LEHNQFRRLVRLFLDRTFHGGDGSGSGELDLSLGLVLSLLALPGALYSLLLFEKYSTLLLWMRGANNFDPVAATIPDEYFFIVLSMVVTGAVAVSRWDSVFPDRRDYMNLVPLPISTKLIFLANLTAVVYLAGTLALVVNAVSAVIFPFAASSGQESFHYVFQLAGTHSLVVLASSFFSFFAIFAIVGLAMAILPYPVFRRASIYIRASILTFLVAMLATSFAVPDLLQGLPNTSVRLLPSVWFLCLGQLLHGNARPAVAATGWMALKSLAFVLVVALATYLASYRRYFLRIPERAETEVGVQHNKSAWALSGLDRIVLHSPLQRAAYRFVLKTLTRSESHSLILAGFVAMAVVTASQTLFAGLVGQAARVGRFPSAEVLAVPLIFVYFITLGLRFAFELPAEHNANWIFRLLVDKDSTQPAHLARNLMLTFVVPWSVTVVPFVYGYFWGWRIALVHVAVVLLGALTLARVALIGYRKIPFTCSYPPFRHSAILLVLLCILGYIGFVVFTARLESLALMQPLWWILLFLLFAAVWAAAWLRETTIADIDKRLLFDEAASSGFEWLDLEQRS
jgi:hypothetical protein